LGGPGEILSPPLSLRIPFAKRHSAQPSTSDSCPTLLVIPGRKIQYSGSFNLLPHTGQGIKFDFGFKVVVKIAHQLFLWNSSAANYFLQYKMTSKSNGANLNREIYPGGSSNGTMRVRTSRQSYCPKRLQQCSEVHLQSISHRGLLFDSLPPTEVTPNGKKSGKKSGTSSVLQSLDI